MRLCRDAGGELVEPVEDDREGGGRGLARHLPQHHEAFTVTRESNESGRFEIYIVGYPNAEARQQISADGGAVRQLKRLRTYDQRAVLDGVQGHLVEAEPDEATRNKFRLRRSSEFADYELRIGDLRVFYRIEASGEIVITVIGIKKGNTLVVEGEQFEI